MEKSKLSNSLNYYSILSGAISGSITAIAFQPLEFVKTKLQQPEYSTANNGSLKNNKRNINLIIRNTLIDNASNGKVNLLNLRKFWTGLSPSLLRSVPVAGFYFGSVDFLKNTKMLSQAKTGGPYELIHSFLIGVLSRTMADFSTHPLNLIKTRYESENFKYKSVWGAFSSIFKQEGVRGLYKGLVPTLLRDISYSGIYFPLYTKTKSILKEHISKESDNKSVYFATCALMSSIMACAITQPPDVIRSYMQINPTVNRTFFLTAQIIFEKNGVRGFFAGFLPRSTRRVLISVMSWTLYEKLSLKK